MLSILLVVGSGISECWNPALQQMFMLIGRAEKAGSGVDKIMSGWKESHWRRPFLEIGHQPDRVKLTLPMFSVIPEAVLNELNTVFDDVSHLSPDELTALSFCQIEGSISNQRLQYVLNMHSADITNLLKKLCAEDYLESDNNGRWTTYKIKSKVDTSEKHATRLSRNELEKLIMNICLEDYIKMDEVARHIGKSVDYLKNKIFPDMIKNGKLVKRFPYTHNRPDQGYKTSEVHAKEL